MLLTAFFIAELKHSNLYGQERRQVLAFRYAVLPQAGGRLCSSCLCKTSRRRTLLRWMRGVRRPKVPAERLTVDELVTIITTHANALLRPIHDW